jgi:AGZA family xanthine/uracil permease-like MFS transporter
MGGLYMAWFAKYFDFEKRNTTLGTEIRAGATTFMTMAYILVVQPLIMSACGMPWDAVFTMTALFSGLATIWMALRAKFPFAIAPGMGTNAIFAFSIVNAGVATWEVALGMIFWAGICIVLVSIPFLRWLKFLGVKNGKVYNFCIREKVVESIPVDLRIGFAAAIGVFLMSLGLGSNGIGLVVYSADGPSLGDVTQPGAIIGLIGIAACAIMFWLKSQNKRGFNVRGAILISMLAITAIMMLFGLTPPPSGVFSLPSGAFDIIFKLKILEALKPEYAPFILVFFMGDVFSTTGTAVSCVAKGGYLDKDGNFDGWDGIFEVDAFCAPGGALFGLTTPTCYVESAAGITDGGRTGMTSLTTGALFLIALLLSPIFISIPPVATGVALIIVGVEMFTSLGDVRLNKPVVAAPLALMVGITLATNDFASAMCIGLAVWVLMAAFSRYVLKEKEHLPNLATQVMAVVIFLMAVVKLAITI